VHADQAVGGDGRLPAEAVGAADGDDRIADVERPWVAQPIELESGAVDPRRIDAQHREVEIGVGLVDADRHGVGRREMEDDPHEPAARGGQDDVRRGRDDDPVGRGHDDAGTDLVDLGRIGEGDDLDHEVRRPIGHRRAALRGGL
jgi:hypothetical protein